MTQSFLVKLTTWVWLHFLFWTSTASFSFSLVFWNKHYKLYNKDQYVIKISIKYMVQGFKPTTFRAWVCLSITTRPGLPLVGLFFISTFRRFSSQLSVQIKFAQHQIWTGHPKCRKRPLLTHFATPNWHLFRRRNLQFTLNLILSLEHFTHLRQIETDNKKF